MKRKRFRQKLEGAYRFVGIKKIKKWLYLLQLLVIIAFSFTLLILRGASLKPFYLPIDSFLYFLLFMFFVLSIENFFFRNLEIRYAGHDSQKFLIARNSIRRGFVVIGLFIFLAVLLLLPATSAFAEKELSSYGSHSLLAQGDSINVTFANQDSLALTRTREFFIKAGSGQISVSLFKDEEFEPQFTTIVSGGDLTLPLSSSALATYKVTIRNTGTSPASFSYTVGRGLAESITSFLPVFAILFIISNLIWITYLNPVRERYSATSIYSIGYIQPTEEGTKLWKEYEVTAQRREAPEAKAVVARPLPHPTEVEKAISPIEEVQPLTIEEILPPPPPMVEITPPPPEAIVAKAKPSDVENILTRGIECSSMGEYDRAVEFYEEALRMEKNNTKALLGKGIALLKMDKGSEALGCFNLVLTLEPGNQAALINKGMVLEEESRWEEALECYDNILDSNPKDTEALMRRGDVLLEMGRKEEALSSYKTGLEISPEDDRIRRRIEEMEIDIPTLLSKALIASASGNYSQAVEFFDHVLRKQPEDLNALLGKGIALKRSGDLEGAERSLDLVLARRENNVAALLNKGRILEERGQLKEALVCYDKILQYNPEEEEAWVGRGDILTRMGMEEEASSSYERALAVNPKDEETKAKLEKLISVREDKRKLMEKLLQIKGVGPAKAKALYAAGFTSEEAFKKAREEDLLAVKGIKGKLSKDIIDHFK